MSRIRKILIALGIGAAIIVAILGVQQEFEKVIIYNVSEYRTITKDYTSPGIPLVTLQHTLLEYWIDNDEAGDADYQKVYDEFKAARAAKILAARENYTMKEVGKKDAAFMTKILEIKDSCDDDERCVRQKDLP